MKRIALVEDSATNRLLARFLLQDHYEVREFETGEAALEGLKSAKPDLILLDLTLPGVGGPDVLAFIRADDSLCDLPVIAFTGGQTAVDPQSYLDSGFDDHISKPILDHKAFLAVIERGLENKRD